MGASFWITPEPCKTCGRGYEGESHDEQAWQLTYNLTPAFKSVSGGDTISEWLKSCATRAKTRGAVVIEARRIMAQIIYNRDNLIPMDCPDGFGTYEQLRDTWWSFLIALEDNPDCGIGCSV